MKRLKHLLVLLIILSPSLVFGQFTPEIRDDRPGLLKSSYTIGKNVFQVHNGVHGVWSDTEINIGAINTQLNRRGYRLENIFRYGILEDLDLIMDFSYSDDQYTTANDSITLNDDFQNTGLRLRYRFLEPQNRGFSGAFEGGWNFNREYMDIALIFGYHYDYHHFHLNLLGASKYIYQTQAQDFGAGLQYALRMRKWNAAVEYEWHTLSFQSTLSDSQTNNVRISFGYKISSGFQLSAYGGWKDEAIATNISDSGTYAGFGITWRLAGLRN
jgi:hypothetical protein